MRRSMPVPVSMLLAALAVAGCDKPSATAGQGTAGGPPAAVSASAVPANLAGASPDEVAPGGGGSSAAGAPAAGAIDRSHAGTPAPAYGFADPAGKPVTLAAFRGRPVLVNLWATWCGPCIKELPTLDALAAREAGKLAVVTLSQDMAAASAKTFLAGRALPHLGAYTDPAMHWLPAVTATLPTTILYGADGRERWRAVGGRDWADAASARALADAR